MPTLALVSQARDLNGPFSQYSPHIGLLFLVYFGHTPALRLLHWAVPFTQNVLSPTLCLANSLIAFKSLLKCHFSPNPLCKMQPSPWHSCSPGLALVFCVSLNTFNIINDFFCCFYQFFPLLEHKPSKDSSIIIFYLLIMEYRVNIVLSR